MNMTSAALVECPFLAEDGLQVNMLRRTEFIMENELLSTMRRDDVSRDVSYLFIAESIKWMHPDLMTHIFRNADRWNKWPEYPCLQKLPLKKTPMVQVGAIFEDEATREGTRRVHDDIFLKKCQYNPDDASGHFTSRLWLICCSHPVSTGFLAARRLGIPSEGMDGGPSCLVAYYAEPSLLDCAYALLWPSGLRVDQYTSS